MAMFFRRQAGADELLQPVVLIENRCCGVLGVRQDAGAVGDLLEHAVIVQVLVDAQASLAQLGEAVLQRPHPGRRPLICFRHLVPPVAASCTRSHRHSRPYGPLSANCHRSVITITQSVMATSDTGAYHLINRTLNRNERIDSSR